MTSLWSKNKPKSHRNASTFLSHMLVSCVWWLYISVFIMLDTCSWSKYAGFSAVCGSVSNRQACAVKQRRERERLTVYVTVRDNNVDQALRVLKKKLQREGVFREMKNRRAYEKPSERRAREAAESTRRVRKLMRKRMEREGY